MPEYTGEAEIKINTPDLIKTLIDAGVPKLFMDNSLTSGIILGDAIDFIKKLGALNEFMKTLSVSDGAFLYGLFKIRPKELGGNPFD